MPPSLEPRPRFTWVRFALASALILASAASVDQAIAKKHDLPTVLEDALRLAPSDRAKAIASIEQAIASRPNGKNRALLMLHAGEQRRLAGQTAEARAWFSRVLDEGRGEQDAARLGLALLDPGEASALEDAPTKTVLDTQNADRYLRLAIDAARRGERRAAAGYSRKALSYARVDADLRQRIREETQSLAEGKRPAPAPVSRRPALEEAEALYAAGDRSGARTQAERALRETTGAERAMAEGLIAALDAGPEDRNRIVVLLPLSGKYELVGEQIRDALTFGYGSGGRQLEFVDSGGTPESAVAALDSAVLTRRAVAVVGPLLTDETDAVVTRAEQLHVPLLSLSQAYEEQSGHHWSLQAMYTRGDQIEALLRYVTTEKGMSSFAVFAPDDPQGATTAGLFKAKVTEKGGRIATEATYSAQETNLIQFAKNLGVRDGDINALRRKAKEAGRNPDSVVVPPVLDFDAIFIPDSAARTPLACAALAYEEFPMGEFQPTRESPKIPLLGLSAWNTPSLIASGNEYTRNSLFTDAYSPYVVPETDPFVTGYRESTGRTPTSLEAAVVDAGKLLAVAAASPAGTRPEFRQALLDASVPNAVTGAVRIDPDTLRAKRKMLILTLTRTALEQVATVEL